MLGNHTLGQETHTARFRRATDGCWMNSRHSLRSQDRQPIACAAVQTCVVQAKGPLAPAMSASAPTRLRTQFATSLPRGRNRGTFSGGSEVEVEDGSGLKAGVVEGGSSPRVVMNLPILLQARVALVQADSQHPPERENSNTSSDRSCRRWSNAGVE